MKKLVTCGLVQLLGARHMKTTYITTLAAALLLTVVCVETSTAARTTKGWISKYASFEVQGIENRESRPGFLTTEGPFYNDQTEDAYAVSLKPGKDTAIIIDLGKPEKISSVVVKNRSNSAGQKGMTIEISKDGSKWQKHRGWTAKTAAYAWCIQIRKNARYVKLLPPPDSKEPFELKWAQVLTGKFGFMNDEELNRLRFDGLPIKPTAGRPIPSWMKDGTGMGLFLHWGLDGWHLLKGSAEKRDQVLAKFIKEFTASDYDPDKWMAPAKAAGFDYSVLTTRHMAGFQLWPSKSEPVGGWGVTKHLDGRDLVRPWVDACRKHDVKVGFYYIPANLMWKSKEFPYAGYPRRNNYVRKGNFIEGYKEKKEEIQKVMDTWLEQDVFVGVEELMTRYGTVDYMWFDGFYWPRGIGLDLQSDRMKEMILGHQPEILLNPRYNVWGQSPDFGDLATAEVRFPAVRPAGPWEFCWCMRGGWFCGAKGKDTSNGTPAVTVLAVLAKCRSWDGYSLADVGPFRDGTMPDYYYGLCEELTKWMNKNKESLLGVKGGPWPELVNVPVTRKDKGKTWYLFAWPQNDEGEFLDPRRGRMGKYDYTPEDKVVTVSNVRNPPAKTTILATGEKIDYKLDAGTMTFVIPKEIASSNLDVIKVEW